MTSAPFTLSHVEQAIVAGSATGAGYVLAGNIGEVSPVVKLIAVVVLAIDAVLGVKHLTSASTTTPAA